MVGIICYYASIEGHLHLLGAPDGHATLCMQPLGAHHSNFTIDPDDSLVDCDLCKLEMRKRIQDLANGDKARMDKDMLIVKIQNEIRELRTCVDTLVVVAKAAEKVTAKFSQ